jgi:hypothetical protein
MHSQGQGEEDRPHKQWLDDVRPEFGSFNRPSKQEETANHEKWKNDPTEQYHVD